LVERKLKTKRKKAAEREKNSWIERRGRAKKRR
jgi:hypothetical protein